MVWFAIIPCVYAACISLYLNSWMAFVFFYAQSTVGFLLLEIVNYVEHYGLARKKLDDGSYEPVNVCHSWNAPHAITNFFLFKLQRHSDHHAFSLRPYQVLRNFADSPQLPTGYAGMIILSLFPSIFFKVMDNRLKNEVNSEIRLKKDDLRPVIQKKNTSLFEFVVFLSIAAAPNLLFLV
jgi:alkane 1-monooxygenase